MKFRVTRPLYAYVTYLVEFHEKDLVDHYNLTEEPTEEDLQEYALEQDVPKNYMDEAGGIRVERPGQLEIGGGDYDDDDGVNYEAEPQVEKVLPE